MMRRVVLGVALLVGCGDSGGGSDGDTQVADGADAVHSDVVVPGPGECELNWVTGFSPFIAVRPNTWESMEPPRPGTVFFDYQFVDGPGNLTTIDVQVCRLTNGGLEFSATSEDEGDIYTLVVKVSDFAGLGTSQLSADDGLEVRLEARAVVDPALAYLSSSTDDSQCEFCVDATGRQGAFRCDGLSEVDGDRGGIRFAGFICPDGEPGFSP